VTDASPPTTVEAVQRMIADLMPVALDLVATVVDEPTPSWDSYSGMLEVAEQESPLLLLAVLRSAAGLAAILDMTGEQIRALGKVDPQPGD
jgi:hypothetical protein